MSAIDLARYGLTSDVKTQRGQLVFVRNDGADHHFTHQNLFRARLRLFLPLAARSLAEVHSLTLATADVIPVLDPVPRARVIKWIAGAAVGARDNLVVYWDTTIVENWLGTGCTAEFTWQPTSEVIEDLYAEDVKDHLAWIDPLRSVLVKADKEEGRARKYRSSYEEEWDWGPELLE